MNADDILTYTEPYLSAVRLLARGIDQASLCRFDRAVELFTHADDQLAIAVQAFERLRAQLRMRSEVTLIQRHCVLPGERAA